MLKHVTVEQETATMKPVIVNVTDNTKHIYEPVVFSLTYRSQNNRKLKGGTLYIVGLQQVATLTLICYNIQLSPNRVN